MLTFTLPLPPSANALTFNLKSGGRAKTKGYTAWLEEAGWHVRTKWREAGKPVFKAPLSIRINVGLESRNRDASNTVKPIEDLLVKAIEGLPDDRWNDEIIVRRDPNIPGFCRVTIAQLQPD